MTLLSNNYSGAMAGRFRLLTARLWSVCLFWQGPRVQIPARVELFIYLFYSPVGDGDQSVIRFDGYMKSEAIHHYHNTTGLFLPNQQTFSSSYRVYLCSRLPNPYICNGWDVLFERDHQMLKDWLKIPSPLIPCYYQNECWFHIQTSITLATQIGQSMSCQH